MISSKRFTAPLIEIAGVLAGPGELMALVKRSRRGYRFFRFFFFFFFGFSTTTRSCI